MDSVTTLLQMRQNIIFLTLLVGWFLVVLLYLFGSIFGRRLLGWMAAFSVVAFFLPSWAVVAFAGLMGLIALQGFASLVIGRRAADSMIGGLLADLLSSGIKGILKILGIPFRLLRWLLGIF